MEDCFASGNGKDGFTIDQYFFVSMLNSVAIDNDRHGINVVSGSRFVLVKGNRIVRNRFCSLVAQNNEFGTGAVLFKGNYAKDYRLAAVCLRGVFDVDVVENMMHTTRNARSTAFYLHNSRGSKIVHNAYISNNRRTVIASNARYVEYATEALRDNKVNSRKFTKIFNTIYRPPKFTVNIRSKGYGSSKTNNRVPLAASASRRAVIFKRKTEYNPLNKEKRNNRIGSDPQCLRGLRMDTVCCPRKCSKCRHSNCIYMDDDCCPNKIEQDASSCDTFAAPCVMSRKHTTGADPKCKQGVRRSKYCCLKSCGKCGGKGCSKRGRNKVCCIGTIKKLKKRCKTTGAPCII